MSFSRYDLILIAITIAIISPIAYFYYQIEKPHEKTPLIAYSTYPLQLSNVTVSIFNNNRENHIAQNDNLLFVVKILNTSSRPLDIQSQIYYLPRNGNTWQSGPSPLERVEPNKMLVQNFTSNPDTVDINTLYINVGAIKASAIYSNDIWKINENIYPIAGSEPKDRYQGSIENNLLRQPGEIVTGFVVGSFQVQSPMEVAQEESTETSQKSLQLAGIIGFSTIMALMANYIISRRQSGISEASHKFSTMARIFEMLDNTPHKSAEKNLYDAYKEYGTLMKDGKLDPNRENPAQVVRRNYDQVGAMMRSKLIPSTEYYITFGVMTIVSYFILKESIEQERKDHKYHMAHFTNLAIDCFDFWDKQNKEKKPNMTDPKNNPITKEMLGKKIDLPKKRW